MADKKKQWKSKEAGGLNFAEALADQVRQFPVVYSRTLPAFKDKQLRDNAWDEIAKAVGLTSGKRAETSFKRLRDRYTRLKKSIEESRRNGNVEDDNKGRAHAELEALSFMDWIYPHIYHRYSRQGTPKHPASMAQDEEHVVTVLQPDYIGDTVKKESPRSESEVIIIPSDKGTAAFYECEPVHDHTRTMVVSHRPQIDNVYTCCTQVQSGLPCHPSLSSREESQYIDSDKGSENSDVEFNDGPKKLREKGSANGGNSQSEDDLFCSFVGSQLRLMSQQQKLIAKYQINNILFQILMQENSGHAPKRLSESIASCSQICLNGCGESCTREPHAQFSNGPKNT